MYNKLPPPPLSSLSSLPSLSPPSPHPLSTLVLPFFYSVQVCSRVCVNHLSHRFVYYHFFLFTLAPRSDALETWLCNCLPCFSSIVLRRLPPSSPPVVAALTRQQEVRTMAPQRPTAALVLAVLALSAAAARQTARFPASPPAAAAAALPPKRLAQSPVFMAHLLSPRAVCRWGTPCGRGCTDTGGHCCDAAAGGLSSPLRIKCCADSN